MNDQFAEFKRLKEWCIKCPIEAAMRIEEQQKEIKALCDSVMIQTRKAERLSEALEFYADEDNHKITGEKVYIGHGDFTEETWIEVERDRGIKARQALGVDSKCPSEN